MDTVPALGRRTAAGGSRRLSQPSRHSSILGIAVGIFELSLGCLQLAFSDRTGGAAYPDVLRTLDRAGTFFVTGGIFTLLSVAARSRRAGVIPAILAVLGAVPLLVVAALAARGAVWTGAIVNAALALGIFADAWRTVTGPGSGRRISTLAVVMAAIGLAFGVMAFGAPHLFQASSYRAILVYRPLFGAGMLGASALLVLGWLVPRLRVATQVVAALPFLGLSAGFAAVRGWSGVLLYALLGSFLAADGVLFRLLARRTAERERHLKPIGATGSWHTVFATAVYSVLGVVLVHLTDGARSPYFFVYFLPIVALA